jgi:hypothetical protein
VLNRKVKIETQDRISQGGPIQKNIRDKASEFQPLSPHGGVRLSVEAWWGG